MMQKTPLPTTKGKRKVVLAVKNWGSEESIHSWKYLKSHILSQSKDGLWKDELVVVHVARSKDKDKERWDQGGAVIARLQTALQPYKHDVFDLEGEPGPLLVDIANKEQADILVLATRGRNAMKKAMMGSMTEFVMQRVNCACLVAKPQVGAGDTYRMKSAAQPQSAATALHAVPNLQPPRAHSPASSPMFGRLGSLPGTTPFNRRVAIAYDTTASGRYLLKWAAETILEPADNVFVVRAVPKIRKPGTSFADRSNVQRLARDALQGQTHITTFNLQQQGNARKSVLGFVAKESVDLLIIGMYKPNTRRKGLALRGNAMIMANRCACPCLVVPMSESALQACVEATDLEIAAAEEEELDSGSESDSDDEEPGVGTPTGPGGSPGAFGTPAAAAAADAADGEEGVPIPPHEPGQAGSPEPGGGLYSLRGGGAAAIKQIRAPLEALFKRRGSTGTATVSDAGGGAGPDPKKALLAALQSGSSSLQAGRYVVEVDGHGAVKSIKASEKHHHSNSLTAAADAAAAAAVVQSDPGTTAASPTGAAAAAAAAAANDGGTGAEVSGLGLEPSLEGGMAEEDSRAEAQESRGVSSSDDIDVQALQRLLAEREAEVAALRQQLQQLAAL